MRKGLFIVYNSAGLESFLQINQKISNISWDCCVYEKYYNDQEKLRHFTNFIYRNNRKYKLFSKMVDSVDGRYGVILCPSEFDADINIFLKKNHKSKIYFYQTGFSDYFDNSDFIRNPELFINSTKFVENLEMAIPTFNNNLDEINLFNNNESIEKIFDNEIRSVEKLNNIDAVVFVDPVDIDFGYIDFGLDLKEYLEENYKGKTILFKYHPRSDIKIEGELFTSLCCNDNLPGELLIDLIKEKNIKDIIFTYPNIISSKIDIPSKLIKYNCDKMCVNVDQYADVFDGNMISINDNVNIVNLEDVE